MLVNCGLLAETWDFIQQHPERYNPDSWGHRDARGETGETHDIAGTALKLLGASFVWTPVACYPPDAALEAVWGCQDVTFTSLPAATAKAVAEHVTAFPKDPYADYFWASVVHDRCPIGLAGRVALGITLPDARILFGEDAASGEIEHMVGELMERGTAQWKSGLMQGRMPARPGARDAAEGTVPA